MKILWKWVQRLLTTQAIIDRTLETRAEFDWFASEYWWSCEEVARNALIKCSYFSIKKKLLWSMLNRLWTRAWSCLTKERIEWWKKIVETEHCCFHEQKIDSGKDKNSRARSSLLYMCRGFIERWSRRMSEMTLPSMSRESVIEGWNRRIV